MNSFIYYLNQIAFHKKDEGFLKTEVLGTYSLTNGLILTFVALLLDGGYYNSCYDHKSD